jgi:dTDP-4-dehydrorhamnose reductase
MKENSDKPLAWITGAGGLIGNAIAIAAKSQGRWCFRPITRADFDLLDFAAVDRLFARERPNLIIHCAAISRDRDCEANPPLARVVNIEATRHLSELAADIQFIFFSTDLVFDGAKGEYVETDPVNPLALYAQTKAQAEEWILKNSRHTIIRTSLTSGVSPTGNRAFNEEMCHAWREDRALKLFVDEFRCPIAADVTARALWELANSAARGIFHLAGSAKLSRYEIGLLVAAQYPKLNPQIVPSSRKDYKGPPRPADTSLNCSKVQKLLSFPLPSFGVFAPSAKGT